MVTFVFPHQSRWRGDGEATHYPESLNPPRATLNLTLKILFISGSKAIYSRLNWQDFDAQKVLRKSPLGWLKRHLNKNVISLKDNVIEDHEVERSLRSSERMVTEFSIQREASNKVRKKNKNRWLNIRQLTLHLHKCVWLKLIRRKGGLWRFYSSYLRVILGYLGNT